MPVARHSLHSIALDLEAAAYLAGWRSADGVLFVAALGESRVGDEVAARIGLADQPIRATVFGRVSAVRRVGRPSMPPGVELTLDPKSLPAARFLALAAQGQEVTFRERAPRYVVEQPLRVKHGAVEVEAVTRNLSEGGCAIGWPGPLPGSGDVLSVRLGERLFPAHARAVVCWTTAAGLGPSSLGLRIIAAGRAARSWRALVASAARAGRAAT